MSPAPAAGTYRRSAGTVHAQRQVPRERLAESSRGGPGPGPGAGPGGRSGLVGGASGLAAALPGDSLLLGDATWASSVRTAIPWMGAGMWYWEVGSLGAKGRRQDLCLGTQTMWGSSGNPGQDMRRPGPRQGTSVHVHTVKDVEQFCHRLIPPFLQRRLTCGAGSHPF